MSLFELPGIRNIKAGLTYFEFKEEYTKLLLEKKLAIGIGTYHQRYGDYCNYHRDNPQPKTTLNIIRGVPGSGKTTLAKLYAEKLKAAHLETDMEFYVDGEYKFDHTKLHSYHKRCLKRQRNCY